MCLTTQALLLFLSLLPEERIEMTESRVVIRAETGAVIWQYGGEAWCTDSPHNGPAKLPT